MRRKYGDRSICRFCELEIEFIGKKHWQDRGGNDRCYDGTRPLHLHKPVEERELIKRGEHAVFMRI